jgi:hypothetical protein
MKREVADITLYIDENVLSHPLYDRRITLMTNVPLISFEEFQNFCIIFARFSTVYSELFSEKILIALLLHTYTRLFKNIGIQ